MKKSPIRRMKQQAETPVVDEVIEQTQATESPMAKKEMNAYAKYSYFMEDTVGLGRNGKRIAHGGVVAGGVWAAGHYGNVEIINSNMPAALGIGAATGFLGTVAMDKLFIDAEQEFLMHRRRLSDADPETQKLLMESAASLLDEMRKTG